MFFKELSKATFQLFFPNQCGACSRDLEIKEEYLCLHCKQEMNFISSDAHAQKLLESVFKGRIELVNIWSLFEYKEDGNTRHIPHKIKYNGHKNLGIHMGRMLGESLTNDHNIDLIIPLPLHYKKERLRGFNQSDLIAQGVAEKIGKPIHLNIIKRIKYNQSQTKFSKYDRWDNVREIFDLERPELIENKHVLLIDDVLTTGATLESAAQEISKAKNTRISIATLAARL